MSATILAFGITTPLASAPTPFGSKRRFLIVDHWFREHDGDDVTSDGIIHGEETLLSILENKINDVISRGYSADDYIGDIEIYEVLGERIQPEVATKFDITLN